MTRRQCLVAGAGGILLAAAARASVPAAAPLAAQELGPGLWLISGAGGHIVALRSGDGVLMVDGGRADRADAVTQAVRQCAGRAPVRALFNTHWHPDHTGYNDVLAAGHDASPVPVIAHENTRLWMGVTIDSTWEQRRYAPRAPAARPTQTFLDGVQSLQFGAETLQYGHLLQAHTDGDLFVQLPRHNVLVAGDVASGGDYPLLDWCTGGWLGGMVAALKLLIARCDAHTRIVPGTGALRTRADLQAQLELCTALLASIARSYFKGETRAQFLGSRPLADLAGRWSGIPDLFLATAYDGAWGHINEIRRLL